MIYDAKKTEKLSPELFKNPTSDFRGAPFWAWNCKLDLEELKRQIEVLKKMGFGGGHMHVRTGMATTYLSDEYMGLIKGCVEKFKEEGMLGWLYDEDRWPSGAAGGYVTRYPEYRSRYLLFTPTSYAEDSSSHSSLDSSARAVRTGNGSFVAAYDVKLNEKGYLESYRRIGEDEAAENTKWYAYIETPNPSPWYNNQTYVNTLDKKAIDKFIEITYEAYLKAVGDEFGKTVPSIFTAEPQCPHKTALNYAGEKRDLTLPWTDDIPETYLAAYGEDILDFFPEVIWDLPESAPSVTRYRYHDHIAERFAEAFADNCGKWCRDHGLMLTGHMMEEPTLESQTAALGEAMRSYRSFGLVGVDMLCDSREYTTVKQTSSAANQYGYPGVLSELYGVTNWDFDFRGHKLQGDWQAALGVTARVPHLSWVSMKGEAKRDYPASINYQVPWHEKYAYVEDHFARVGSALTRGKPMVNVGVIHPVESYWLHWGPGEHTRLVRNQMDDNFRNFINWMLLGTVDFDYICEANLPDQCKKEGAPLNVGEMNYSTVIVPGCETIRSTTLDKLEAFSAAGGKLVFAGNIPTLVDAVPSDRAKLLAEKSICIAFERKAILDAVADVRDIEIRGGNGSLTGNLLYRMRKDNTGNWLFIAQAHKAPNPDVPHGQGVNIRIKGEYAITLYDTLTGEIRPISAVCENGSTLIRDTFFPHDSRLFFLEEKAAAQLPSAADERKAYPVRLPALMEYTMDEGNVFVLDMAEYCLDDEDFRPAEELLRADNILRRQLGWPSRMDAIAQPWVVPEEPFEHTAHLRFTVESDIEVEGALLAIEDGDIVSITLNGEKVENNIVGYYTDRSILSMPLPRLLKGTNIITVDVPFNRRANIENAFILGDFGVECFGAVTKIVAKKDRIAFGDIVPQGMPFYGSNITYKFEVVTEGGDLRITVPQYRGGLVSVEIDGEDRGNIVYAPYTETFTGIPAGTHTVGLKLWGSRVNSFGPLHLSDPTRGWIGPDAFRSTGASFSYQYNLKKVGILSSP
ncbi:MAG: hypothetical protein IKZ19_07985, partial [Clostridia bacterium]|nr:hypothetical protein [Clostridia bacterium]